MLKKDELKILKLLLSDITKQWSIREISLSLHQNYFQTHRTVSALAKAKQILLTTLGKNKLVQLDFTKYNPNYTIVEIERAQDAKKQKHLSLIKNQILTINRQCICLLFGSQVKEQRKESDIDLLFVLPDDADYSLFEKQVKMILSPYNCDINIVTQRGLLEMWANPKKLNVGNEILKKHIVFYGAEHFINLLREHYVGQ